MVEYKPPVQEEPRNDFHDFVENIRGFWDKFGLTTLLVILVMLVGVLGYRYIAGREQRQLERAYQDLAVAENPFAIEDAASRHAHVPGFRGYALLQAAEMRATDAMGLRLSGPEQPPLNEEEKTRNLGQAEELYQRVVELNQSSLQVLNARFGLASIYETLGRFDAAREQYLKIQEEAGDRWQVMAARAKERMASLDEIATPITFPPPQPRAETEGQPQLELPPGLPDLGPPPAQPAPDAQEAPQAPETPEAPEAPAPQEPAPATP